MSKKASKDKTGFLCVCYSGCLKVGYVRFFSTDASPESEFEKYRDHYGPNVKGKYVVLKSMSSAEAMVKLKQEIAKLGWPNTHGDIYESTVLNSVKAMKTATDTKKAKLWGHKAGDDEAEDGESEEDAEKAEKTDKTEKTEKADKTEKTEKADKTENKKKVTGKVVAKGKKSAKPEAEEIDKEEDDSCEPAPKAEEPKKADKTDKADKGDKGDKGDKAEKGDKADPAKKAKGGK